jgi:hypothetical protein
MSEHTRAELDTAVALASERRHAPTREEVDHLLDRSREHDRRVARIDERVDESIEYFAERSRQHDSQLTELCDKWNLVSTSLTQQAREIERLNAALRALEDTVADSRRTRTRRARRPIVSDALGRVLYWFCCGIAVASLAGSVGLMTDLLNAATINVERSFLPLELIGLSIVAALAALALGRILARRRSEIAKAK